MSIVMSPSWVKMAAAVAAAGLAVSACGTVKMGAAAVTNDSRISSATLTTQVANLKSAYTADVAKGIKPQRATGQETQQVLTWLILFNVYDKIAAQQNIYISPAQAQRQLAALSSQAASSKATLTEYVSAAGAVPPDLVPQLGQYFAILSALEGRLDGGKLPTSTAGQTALQSKIGHQQCLASKALGVTVNPQYGVWDYRTYSVVPTPPTLAANPGPSPSTTPVVTTPPC
jgi:hypothetical protein